jgi:hypothetical protein
MILFRYGSIDSGKSADNPVAVLKQIIFKKSKSFIAAGNKDETYYINFYESVIILKEDEPNPLFRLMCTYTAHFYFCYIA